MSTLPTIADPPYGASSGGTGTGSFYGQSSAPRSGLTGNLQQIRDNLQLVEDRLEAVASLFSAGVIAGSYAGTLLSIGAGLSVNVAAFSALVGMPGQTNLKVTLTAQTVGGLTPSATNSIFLKQDGTFAINTTGTNPGTSSNPAILLGTATTAAGSVTSVNNTRSEVQLLSPSGPLTVATLGVGGANTGGIVDIIGSGNIEALRLETVTADKQLIIRIKNGSQQYWMGLDFNADATNDFFVYDATAGVLRLSIAKITGLLTLPGALSVGGVLGVAGVATLAALNASGAVVLSAAGTALTVNNNAVVSGTLGVGGANTGGILDVVGSGNIEALRLETTTADKQVLMRMKNPSQQYWMGLDLNADASNDFFIYDGTAGASRLSIAKTTGAVTIPGAVTVGGTLIGKQVAATRQTVTGAAGLTIALDSGGTVQINLGATNSITSVTGLVDGGIYRFILKQDASGSRTLTWGSSFKFAGGTAPTLTTTATTGTDCLTFLSDGTYLWETARSLDVR